MQNTPTHSVKKYTHTKSYFSKKNHNKYREKNIYYFFLLKPPHPGGKCKTYVDNEKVSSATIEDKFKNLLNSTTPTPKLETELVHCTVGACPT